MIKDITIVAPNCWSYYFHNEMKLEYCTPFIDIYINMDEYLYLVENFFKN